MSAPVPAVAVVVVGTVDRDTADEALRAAVGLTLRGARVHVVLADPAVALGPGGQRARATLALFGHRVVGPEALRAELEQATVVEVWGPVPRPAAEPAGRQGLTHLVRPGRAPAVRDPADRVIELPDVRDGAMDDATADRALGAILDGRVLVW